MNHMGGSSSLSYLWWCQNINLQRQDIFSLAVSGSQVFSLVCRYLEVCLFYLRAQAQLKHCYKICIENYSDKVFFQIIEIDKRDPANSADFKNVNQISDVSSVYFIFCDYPCNYYNCPLYS